MSETAVAKPAAKTAAPAEPTPVRAQKLRDVLVKKFTPSSLQAIGQDYEIMTVTAGADWSFADVITPLAWSNVAPRVAEDKLNSKRAKIGSLIFVNSPNFLAHLRINGVFLDDLKTPSGLDVICVGPSVDIKTGKSCPVNVKTGMPWIDPIKAE